MQESNELSVIERFRESHHAVARMFASGMTPSMIRQRTGYSFRRLTLLSADPTFQQLIAHYARQVDEAWNANLDTYLDLGMGNMIRAESQIAEHLDRSEDTGELLPLGALDRISQGRADRFGYSKHNVIEHKHDFATMLDRAIARSGKAEAVKLIEGQAIEVSTPPPLPAPQELVATPTRTLRSQPARSFEGVLRVRRKLSA